MKIFIVYTCSVSDLTASTPSKSAYYIDIQSDYVTAVFFYTVYFHTYVATPSYVSRPRLSFSYIHSLDIIKRWCKGGAWTPDWAATTQNANHWATEALHPNSFLSCISHCLWPSLGPGRCPSVSRDSSSHSRAIVISMSTIVLLSLLCLIWCCLSPAILRQG